MNSTGALASFCQEVKFKQLPDHVIDRVKYLFLDFLGVACRGSIEDSSRSLGRFIREESAGNQQGVMIGTGEKASYLMAALANGTFAHAIEMDDVHNESSLHPGVVIYPAALAGSEKLRASGKRFIEAVVAGYEVMIRLGIALGPENSYRRGFHPTGTCGAFGAAMAVSKLYGLRGQDLVHALGIAGSQAAGSMEYLAQGAWTKRFHAGWAALSGMIAAQLAKQKFKGPETIIEGRFGFLQAYSEKADPQKVLEGLGSGWEILHTSIKPYACCRYMQPPIDAVLQIMKDHKLKAEDVTEVHLGILRAGALLIAEPREEKVKPKSIVDAQFSMPFGAAVAILCGKAGLKEFQLPIIRSEQVKIMMKKVTCRIDPALGKKFPKQWAGKATIKTKAGKVYTTQVEYPRGDPENPLSWEELIEKFHQLSSGIYRKDQRLKIITQVRRLEKIQDFQQWSPLLLRIA